MSNELNDARSSYLFINELDLSVSQLSMNRYAVAARLSSNT